MVHKTTHRGVHSGHTLRAFNSRFSRRYHHQSCIVSRIRPELIRKLTGGGSKSGDQLINIAVDVPLSLNKQARWFLPSALIRQVQSNDVADSKLTVSVLERHKLKQQASCVSFHSNQGEVKRIQPRNGRYFGFSYPSADGKSRRALRRERREALRADNSKKRKTLEVHTEEGQEKSIFDLGDSEVRYEVYYPCPAFCSIAHNPKYIKQGVQSPPGAQVTEHVQSGKPRKQHRGKQRKRMSVKDLEACDLPSFQFLSLRENDPSDNLPSADMPVTAASLEELETAREEADTEGRMLTAGEDSPTGEVHTTTECLLTTLIDKACQLHNYQASAKHHQKKRNNRNAAHLDHNTKSHIVYVNNTDLPSAAVQASEKSSQLTCPPPLPSPVEATTRVLLPKEDVTLTSLKSCFGQNYFEAACRPRKFILDVSVNVQAVLEKLQVQPRLAEKASEAYLVCVHDGIYDDQYDVYKVSLNSRLHHQGLLSVQIHAQESQDLYRGTVMSLISQTMDFVHSLVTGLQGTGELSMLCSDVVTLKPPTRELKGHLATAQAYVPTSVRSVFHKGSGVREVAMQTLDDLLQEDPVFCDLCYEDISPMSLDSASSTALLQCGHQACDSCWWTNIHRGLAEEGAEGESLPCPGHDCQQEVDLGVLLSLVPLPTVERLLLQQEEARVSGSSLEKFCPNPACGHLIQIQASPSSTTTASHCQQDVLCACGSHICFQCLAPAHWPASCLQARDYRAVLGTTDFTAEVPHGGEAEEGEELNTTSAGSHKPGSKVKMEDGAQASTSSRRQRSSLLDKAVEHHSRQKKEHSTLSITTLAKKVASAAAKDGVLTQHILKTCAEAFPSSSTPSPGGASSASTVLGAVTAFLRKAARSQRELHQLVEYSLVLLKDLPDSLLRRRALRISEDLGAFCSFSQSVFEAWGGGRGRGAEGSLQDGVKAVLRLAEIQGWVHSALDAHIATVRKLRSLH